MLILFISSVSNFSFKILFSTLIMFSGNFVIFLHKLYFDANDLRRRGREIVQAAESAVVLCGGKINFSLRPTINTSKVFLSHFIFLNLD